MSTKKVLEYTIVPNSRELLDEEILPTAKTKRAAFRKARAIGHAYVIQRFRRTNGTVGIRVFNVQPKVKGKA